MNTDEAYSLGMKDFNDGKVFGCSLPRPVSDVHKAQSGTFSGSLTK